MRAVKAAVMVALAGTVALGCAACDHSSASGPVSGTSSDSANPTGELGDIQATLDNIDKDIAGDGSP
ncbi:MAG: hypothetical protein JWQ81_3277 [Amycolatopsis sp.]|uniref:hypothetical protein n=1 Tax=Amycolatopsis sp. TaxID=37632 RepID=UPI0026339390|nr:hypothetical protein [Amycolatopsis sp.]MCU1682538.1 hypothetical protein [Amycolatopsis sp.]